MKATVKSKITELCTAAVRRGNILLIGGACLAAPLATFAQDGGVVNEFAPDPTPSTSAGDDGMGTVDNVESSDPGSTWTEDDDNDNPGLNSSTTDDSGTDGCSGTETEDCTMPDPTISVEPTVDLPDPGFQDPWGTPGNWDSVNPQPDYPAVPDYPDTGSLMDAVTATPEPTGIPSEAEMFNAYENQYRNDVINGLNQRADPQNSPSGSDLNQAPE